MTKNELPEKVEYYAAQLSSDHADDAWHALVELGPAALPHVIHAFEAQSEPSVAVALIRVASEYRTKDALPFFATLLAAQDGNIWKTALNGIVSLGDESAVTRLRAASETLGNEKLPWVEEAIGQIKARDG
jgi:HEAT repeat protein